MKLQYKILVTIDTNRSDEEIRSALKKGICTGLDIKHIARPQQVEFDCISLKAKIIEERINHFYCNDEVHYPKLGKCKEECELCYVNRSYKK